MKPITIDQTRLTDKVVLQKRENDSVTLLLPAKGGGIYLPECMQCSERYLTFFLTNEEDHSMAFNMLFYCRGEKEAAFTVRFGILGQVRSRICVDLNWTDAHALFPESTAGQQKVVCHGRRIEKEEIERVELVSLPCFHEVTVKLEQTELTDEYPANFPIAEEKLVDELGQNKKKEWSSKLHGEEELKNMLQKQYAQSGDGYPFADWSAYGGWKKKKLTEGAGYFSSVKKDGRWWLADPEGYAFFSLGPDCVGVNGDCRVDGLEQWMDWLPDREEKEWADCWRVNKNWPPSDQARRECTLFSFGQANLRRAFENAWYEKWKKMMIGQLKRHGLNTLGNWSDPKLFEDAKIPYVTSLPEFPGTAAYIFRDFPDVLSEEYEQNARRCAKALAAKKEDPFMIGYFLRNEPSWAFVDNLVLADEVLFSDKKTACRGKLIEELREKYKTIDKLNDAWHTAFGSFDELYEPQKNLSKRSPKALEDLRGFSKKMLEAYVAIPAKACRMADPNHMILGMRWAWISDPDLVTGWENFDVFSINCYAEDPTGAIQNVVNLGVDLPVMIGEFHFGALDAGPTATGLEGVKTQKDRGIAYRYYCERAAAHPHGVGCHYFQCYDQFVLGRFDGENYNIGLFDICSRPYPEMMESVKECSKNIYEVAEGRKRPSEEKAETIPMIAY